MKSHVNRFSIDDAIWTTVTSNASLLSIYRYSFFLPLFSLFFFFVFVLVWNVIFNMESSMGYLVFCFFFFMVSWVLLEWEKLPMIALSLNEIKTKKSEMPKVFEPFWMDFKLFFFFWFWSTGVLVFNWVISLWISIVWENACPSHVSSPTLGILDGFPISLLGVMLLFSIVGFPFSSLFGAALQYDS